MIKTPTGEQGNTQIFPNITGYTVQFMYRSRNLEENYAQELVLVYNFTPQEENREPFAARLFLANTTASSYLWDQILIPSQVVSASIELANITILDKPLIQARCLRYQDWANSTYIVLYWPEKSVFTINNASQQYNVELNLFTLLEPKDINNTQAQLTEIAKAIASYWEPVRTGTFTSLFVSQHGLELGATATTLIVSLVIFYLFELRRQAIANANALQKLSRQNQQLIDAIRKTQKASLPSIERISETYKTATGEAFTTALLGKRMTELEKVGIVRSTISNNQDEPSQTWKTRISFGPAKH
jgi:hypothetical protein